MQYKAQGQTEIPNQHKKRKFCCKTRRRQDGTDRRGRRSLQTNIKRGILDAERGKGVDTVLCVRVRLFNAVLHTFSISIKRGNFAVRRGAAPSTVLCVRARLFNAVLHTFSTSIKRGNFAVRQGGGRTAILLYAGLPPTQYYTKFTFLQLR